jgi:Fe-Mn family superoxide dismutase
MAENWTPLRTTRRGFIGGAIATGAAFATRAGASPAAPDAGAATRIELPALPYGESALAPYISQETISFHYGKHHRAYVDNTNKLIAGTDLAGASLGDVVRASAGKPDRKALFNNAAQVWNHTFYWNSLSPKGGGQPTGKLLDRIKSDFGDFAKLRDDLAKAALTQFGSGWAWLLLENGRLAVEQTANAETPLATPGKKPLLALDVWEHAYYVDYRNDRLKYIGGFWGVVNWDFAAEMYAGR